MKSKMILKVSLDKSDITVKFEQEEDDHNYLTVRMWIKGFNSTTEYRFSTYSSNDSLEQWMIDNFVFHLNTLGETVYEYLPD